MYYFARFPEVTSLSDRNHPSINTRVVRVSFQGNDIQRRENRMGIREANHYRRDMPVHGHKQKE